LSAAKPNKIDTDRAFNVGVRCAHPNLREPLDPQPEAVCRSGATAVAVIPAQAGIQAAKEIDSHQTSFKDM
jgi:hypothetical protein